VTSASVPGSPAPAPVREGQTFAGASKWVTYANFVKLPHTVFALPFALVGVVLASYDVPIDWGDVVWVVVAFTCARFVGMGFNRIADREIDARNPRTRMREIPAGVLGLKEAIASVVIAGAIFIIASWQLNPLCGMLSPVALAWVCFYSFTKRFTRWSHLVLGFGMSMAPVGGYLAVVGQWSHPWWMLIALSMAVTTWGGGFDVLYALQDVEFDRGSNLHSIPAAIGEQRAVALSRFLHCLAILSLALVGAARYSHSGEGMYYAIGMIVAAALLFYEHTLVKPDDLTKLDAAFFTMNGIISMAFLAFVLIERLVNDPRATLIAGPR
jgi:4-hydroxybenzoate polyprenyltransferase